MMALFGLFKRRKPPAPIIRNIPTQTPGQQQYQKFLLDKLPGLYNQLEQFQDVDFSPIEEQARTEFSTQTIPALAERFTSMGGGGQRSTGFQSALGRAGSTLEGELAAQRANFSQNLAQLQNQRLLGLLGSTSPAAMQQAFIPYLQMPQPSMAAGLVGRGISALGSAGIGYLTGGPSGAALGGLSAFMKQ